MYRICKAQHDIVYIALMPIFCTSNTIPYKFEKFLVPILKSLTSNEYKVNYSFAFNEEIIEQDSEFLVGGLDVDTLFTIIPLEKTIDICSNWIFENTRRVESLSEMYKVYKEYEVKIKW